jgi:2'-5' RNA ligase
MAAADSAPPGTPTHYSCNWTIRNPEAVAAFKEVWDSVQVVAEGAPIAEGRENNLDVLPVHPAHVTLKYGFNATEAQFGEFEGQLERFVAEDIPTCSSFDVSIAQERAGGVGHFGTTTLFAAIRVCDAVQAVIRALHSRLAGLSWLEQSPFDGENLHLHATLAMHLTPTLFEIVETRALEPLRQRGENKLLNGRGFDLKFDNVTLYKYAKGADPETIPWHLCRPLFVRSFDF